MCLWSSHEDEDNGFNEISQKTQDLGSAMSSWSIRLQLEELPPPGKFPSDPDFPCDARNVGYLCPVPLTPGAK